MLGALTAAAGIAAVSAASLRVSDEFSAWASQHGKSYSREEKVLRGSIFAANKAKIDAHNALGLPWTQGINKFADLTGDEWRARVTSGKRNKLETAPEAPPVHYIHGGALPDSVNWTAQGKVNAVKDQAQCGSCWAFATVLAVEGDYAVNKGSLVSLSEEQIVQCDYNTGDGNSGCDGGDQLRALTWLAKQPGLCTEAAYPYTSGGGRTGTCQHSCTPTIKIGAGVEVPLHNETALMAAIANYPLSLSVDASDDSVWQFYTGGVVTGKCGNCQNARCLDHGVGGVGYGTMNGNDFWLVRNSWGADWGMKGYILLGRGDKFSPYGQCGVQIDNQYSVNAAAV